MNFKALFRDFIALFYPNLCLLCGEPLVRGEYHLCLSCLLKIPKTNYHLQSSNSMEVRLAGKFPFQKVSAYLFYNKGGLGAGIISEIKYKKNREFGTWFSREAAKDMAQSTFFEGIEWIVPVPLHPKKLKKRGFNQAELMADAFSEVTGIPMNSRSLCRKIGNSTQTRKGSYERWLNTMDIFALREPDCFAGKHILLVDDVLTTGSTLESAARCLLSCKDVKISVLTMAVTQ